MYKLKTNVDDEQTTQTTWRATDSIIDVYYWPAH